MIFDICVCIYLYIIYKYCRHYHLIITWLKIMFINKSGEWSKPSTCWLLPSYMFYLFSSESCTSLFPELPWLPVSRTKRCKLHIGISNFCSSRPIHRCKLMSKDLELADDWRWSSIHPRTLSWGPGCFDWKFGLVLGALALDLQKIQVSWVQGWYTFFLVPLPLLDSSLNHTPSRNIAWTSQNPQGGRLQVIHRVITSRNGLIFKVYKWVPGVK